MLNDHFQVQLRRGIRLVIPLTDTVEVLAQTYGDLCPLPGMHPWLLGVVNQRGHLLWVLDLAQALGLPPETPTPQPFAPLKLLVLSRLLEAPATGTRGPLSGGVQLQVGAVLTALEGIVPLDPATYRPLPPQVPASVRPLLQGMVVLPAGKALVLKVGAIARQLSQPPSPALATPVATSMPATSVPVAPS